MTPVGGRLGTVILSIAVGDPRRQAPGRGQRAKVELRTDSSEESFRVVEAGKKYGSPIRVSTVTLAVDSR